MERKFSKREAENAAEARAICVHAQTRADLFDGDELPALAETLGYTVVGNLSFPLRRIHPGQYIGEGQMERLKELVKAERADVVLFDNELSPSQITNIEEAIEAGVMTRTETILEIFSLRAKTQIAKLQVERAILEFEYPRLRGKWSHFGRIVGASAGMGVKGMGETQLEVDRRRARERMHGISRELKRLERSKSIGRKARSGAFRIALVGYTNAGKSSLFNALTKERMYVENKLFATLDTFTRKLYLNETVRLDVLISDTVGFINQLPHALIESFKSTLAEVAEADVLVHVIDASKRAIEADIESVYRALDEVGATNVPKITALNKIDCVDAITRNALSRKFPFALPVSAKTEEGLDLLKARVTTAAREKQKILYPYSVEPENDTVEVEGAQTHEH